MVASFLHDGNGMNMPGLSARGAMQPAPLLPGEMELAEDAICWSLVERKLLSPAGKAGVECLVRFERADGVRPHWRPGDLVELGGSLRPDTAFESLVRRLPGPRHGAVSLLPGGWPVDTDCRRRTGVELRLPIASSAASRTLDLLVFTGGGTGLAHDADACRHLLFGTAVDLRIIRSPAHHVPAGPLLLVGDRIAAAFARAILQEDDRPRRLILIENGKGDAPLPFGAIFPNRCWRDGTVRGAPHLADAATLPRILEAQRRAVRGVMGEGGQILVAGASEDFLSLAWRGLGAFFGDEDIVSLGAAGRLATIRL